MLINRKSILIIFLSLFPLSFAQYACDSGWVAYGRKCYHYVAQKLNFDQALATCLSQNATLASIHSLDELTFVEYLARRHSTASGVHWLWLGGVRQPNLTFRWTDGSLFKFARWRHNCPDRRRSEDCLLMSVFNSKPSHWCNYRCATNYDHAICQKPQNPVKSRFANSTWISGNSKNSSSIVPSCLSQWIRFGSSSSLRCARVLNRTGSWHSALSMCQALNGTLLTVQSDDEQQLLQHYLFEQMKVNEAVWLGAVRNRLPESQLKSKDQFIWADNRVSLTYVNFAEHEPDNRGTNENCVAMNNMIEFAGKWLDAPCDVHFAIACQRMPEEIVLNNDDVATFPTDMITPNDFMLTSTDSSDLNDLADEMDAPDAPDSTEPDSSSAATSNSNRMLSTLIGQMDNLQKLLLNETWAERMAKAFWRQKNQLTSIQSTDLEKNVMNEKTPTYISAERRIEPLSSSSTLTWLPWLVFGVFSILLLVGIVIKLRRSLTGSVSRWSSQPSRTFSFRSLVTAEEKSVLEHGANNNSTTSSFSSLNELHANQTRNNSYGPPTH